MAVADEVGQQAQGAPGPTRRRACSSWAIRCERAVAALEATGVRPSQVPWTNFARWSIEAWAGSPCGRGGVVAEAGSVRTCCEWKRLGKPFSSMIGPCLLLTPVVRRALSSVTEHRRDVLRRIAGRIAPLGTGPGVVLVELFAGGDVPGSGRVVQLSRPAVMTRLCDRQEPSCQVSGRGESAARPPEFRET